MIRDFRDYQGSAAHLQVGGFFCVEYYGRASLPYLEMTSRDKTTYHVYQYFAGQAKAELARREAL